MKDRIAKLIDVKSIVTLALTGGFLYLMIRGNTPQEFMTIYTVVIAFYFGTQYQKAQARVDEIIEVVDESEVD